MIDESREGEDEIEVALEVASLFRLAPEDALEVLAQVVSATSRWADVANTLGLPSGEIDRMSGAFRTASTETATRALAAA